MAFGFHAVKIGNIQAVQKNPFDPRIRQAAAASDFEPAPRTVAAAETATTGKRRATLSGDLFQMSANGPDVGGVHQRVKAAADKLVRTVNQTGLECGIRKLQNAVCG